MPETLIWVAWFSLLLRVEVRVSKSQLGGERKLTINVCASNFCSLPKTVGAHGAFLTCVLSLRRRPRKKTAHRNFAGALNHDENTGHAPAAQTE